MLPLSAADKAKLFDKDPTSTVILPAGATWHFKFKAIFEISKIKVTDTDLVYIPNIQITPWMPVGGFGVVGGNPYIVNDEIRGFSVKNNGATDVIVAEIFVETMEGVNLVSTEIATEAVPLNVKEIGTLVAEDIPEPYLVTIYDESPPSYRALTDSELSSMFDKVPSTYFTIPAPNPDNYETANILVLGFKSPFDIKRLKILDTSLHYIYLGTEDVYVVTSTPSREREAITWSEQPMLIDDEIIGVIIYNHGTSDVIIGEIIGTIYHPVEAFPQDPDGMPIKSPPEHQPINVQEMPELIPEAIREVEIYPYAEMIGFVEKNIPTVEEHIGFVQKGYEEVEEHIGFIEKGYSERFIGYSEKPKALSQRFIGFSEKPTTVTPRFIGYSEKPTTVTPRFMGYGERPAPEEPPVEGEPVWYNEIYVIPA